MRSKPSETARGICSLPNIQTVITPAGMLPAKSGTLTQKLRPCNSSNRARALRQLWGSPNHGYRIAEIGYHLPTPVSFSPTDSKMVENSKRDIVPIPLSYQTNQAIWSPIVRLCRDFWILKTPAPPILSSLSRRGNRFCFDSTIFNRVGMSHPWSNRGNRKIDKIPVEFRLRLQNTISADQSLSLNRGVNIAGKLTLASARARTVSAPDGLDLVAFEKRGKSFL